MPIVMGSVLLAGAALAAGVTIVTMTREQSVPLGTAADVEPSAATCRARRDARARNTGRRGSRDAAGRPTSVELVETALSMAPLVRNIPQYPVRALARGVEGHVQVKFDVTAAGVVENVTVIESSDALFEDAAVEAVAQWRYLPRIAAGKRVASEGVHTVIRFALEGDQTPPNPRTKSRDRGGATRISRVLGGARVALDRLAADDLRGAELQLDEMQAVLRRDAMAISGTSTATCSRFKATTAARSMPTRRPSPSLLPQRHSDGRRRSCRSRISTSRAINTTWR